MTSGVSYIWLIWQVSQEWLIVTVSDRCLRMAQAFPRNYLPLFGGQLRLHGYLLDEQKKVRWFLPLMTCSQWDKRCVCERQARHQDRPCLDWMLTVANCVLVCQSFCREVYCWIPWGKCTCSPLPCKKNQLAKLINRWTCKVGLSQVNLSFLACSIQTFLNTKFSTWRFVSITLNC